MRRGIRGGRRRWRSRPWRAGVPAAGPGGAVFRCPSALLRLGKFSARPIPRDVRKEAGWREGGGPGCVECLCESDIVGSYEVGRITVWACPECGRECHCVDRFPSWLEEMSDGLREEV
jgi:hypothetical protein